MNMYKALAMNMMKYFFIMKITKKKANLLHWGLWNKA